MRSLAALLVLSSLAALLLWRLKVPDDKSPHDTFADIPDDQLFAPWLHPDAGDFDPNTALFDGKPFRDLLEAGLHGTPQEREHAVLMLGCVQQGCARSEMHSLATGRPLALRRRMLPLVREGMLASRTRAVLPTLLKTIDDPEPRVRSATACVLTSIETEALSACDALTQRLSDPDTKTRLWSARALYIIRFEVEAPMRCSIDALLHDGDPRCRGMAAFNLEIIGRDAVPAIPALQQATKDDDESVRSLASQALRYIR